MINKLFDLIFENPYNVNIQYTDINGEKKLLINGKECVLEDLCLKEQYDDSEIKKRVVAFKQALTTLKDDLFVLVVDKLSEIVDVKRFNDLLDQESFTEEEADNVDDMIDTANDLIEDLFDKEIQELESLKEIFNI